MEKMAKCSGNTIPRITPSKYWCFTDFDADLAKWQTTFYKNNIKYIIGKEICPSTGKAHLQGYIEAPSLIRPLEKFKEFKSTHWEKRKGTREQNIAYCSKENNFVTNFENITIKKKVGKPMNDQLILQEWMNETLEYIESPRDNRKILWIYDLEGGKGKTKFCKYILQNYENCIYFTGGRAIDITSQILENDYDPELCLFDIPRCNEGHISYNALEQVKNGLINSSKYKGGFRIFDCPHIIVFANFRPDINALSHDRWIIHRIM